MAQAPETVVETSAPPRDALPGWLAAVIAWQVVVAVGAVGAALLIITGVFLDLSGLGLVLVAGLLLAGGVASGVAALRMSQRRHMGRALGIGVDYLLGLGAAFVALQDVGVFVGLDAFGATFRRAVPLLLLVLAGWLLLGQAERFGSAGPVLGRAGRWLMAIGAVALLLRANLLQGLATLAARLAEPVALAATVIAVAAGAAFWLLRRTDARILFGTSRREEEALDGLLFVSPNVIGFLAFFAGPLLFSLFVAFTAWDGLSDITWLGPDNFITIFSLDFATVAEGQNAIDALKEGYVELFSVGDLVIGARDRIFWLSLRNILVFGLFAVPLAVFPALGLAALLNTKTPGVKFFRAVYFIPSVAGVVGIALIWKQLFNASVGFINYGILRVYDLVNLLPGADFTAPQPEWLSSDRTALFAVVVVFAWQLVGFNTVLYLAGMQSIPTTLYQAASIDGAGPWAQFRRITVPMLKPTTVFVVATTTILALQLFNEPFILFAPQLPPSGPNNAVATPVVHLYQEAFRRFNQGYASALAWVLFILIFGITLLYFRRQREDEEVLG